MFQIYRIDSNPHIAHNLAICDYYIKAPSNARQSLKKVIHEFQSIDRSLFNSKSANESIQNWNQRHYLLYNKAESYLNKHQYSAAIDLFTQLINSFNFNTTSNSNTSNNSSNTSSNSSNSTNKDNYDISIYIRACVRLFSIYYHHNMIFTCKNLLNNNLIKNNKYIENALNRMQTNVSKTSNNNSKSGKHNNNNRKNSHRTKQKLKSNKTKSKQSNKSKYNVMNGNSNDSNETSDNDDMSDNETNEIGIKYDCISLVKYQYYLLIMECQILLMEQNYSQCFEKLKEAIKLMKSNSNNKTSHSINNSTSTNNNVAANGSLHNESINNHNDEQTSRHWRSSDTNFDRIDRVRILFIRAHLEMLQGKTNTAKSQLLATHSKSTQKTSQFCNYSCFFCVCLVQGYEKLQKRFAFLVNVFLCLCFVAFVSPFFVFNYLLSCFTNFFGWLFETFFSAFVVCLLVVLVCMF